MAIAWLTVAVGITGVIAIPALITVIRLAMRWKGFEDRLNTVVDDVEKLVESTDRRLRWLEENIWRRPGRRSLPSRYRAVMVL